MPLEAMTLAYVCVTLLTYGFRWRKPRDTAMASYIDLAHKIGLERAPFESLTMQIKYLMMRLKASHPTASLGTWLQKTMARRELQGCEKMTQHYTLWLILRLSDVLECFTSGQKGGYIENGNEGGRAYKGRATTRIGTKARCNVDRFKDHHGIGRRSIRVEMVATNLSPRVCIW